MSAKAGEKPVVALVDPKAAGVTLNPQRVTTGETRHELVMKKVQVPTADIVATGAQLTGELGQAICAEHLEKTV